MEIYIYCYFDCNKFCANYKYNIQFLVNIIFCINNYQSSSLKQLQSNFFRYFLCVSILLSCCKALIIIQRLFPQLEKRKIIFVLLTSHIWMPKKEKRLFVEKFCWEPIIPIICIWSLSGLGKIYIDFCDDFHSMKSRGNFPCPWI